MARRSGSTSGSTRKRPRSSGANHQSACVLPRGTAVTVRGLTTAVEHNGKSGTVVSWDSKRSRYEVDVDSKSLSLKPQNLTQVCTVELVGLESRPELNGKIGEIFNYDEEKGRYMVRLATSDTAMKFRPGNCILKQGAHVIVQGLSVAQLNGLMGKIVGNDRDAQRYVVQLQSGKQIKIKYDNALC